MQIAAPKVPEKQLYDAYLKTGNMQHIAQVFEQNRSLFIGWLRKRGFKDCDDLLQEGYIKIQLSLQQGKYQPKKAPIQLWMLRVIKNHAIDLHRRRPIEHKLHGISLDLPLSEDNETPARELLAELENEQLLFGLLQDDIPAIVGLYKLVQLHRSARVIERTRDVIEHRLMGLKFKDIATILQCNQITLRATWHRAVKEMAVLAAQGKRNPDFTHEDLLQIEMRGQKIKTLYNL